MWLDDEATTMTATSNTILSSNFPYQPPIDEVVYNRNTDILEEVVIYTGNYYQWNMKWDNYYLGGISLDVRIQLPQTKERFNHYRKWNLSHLCVCSNTFHLLLIITIFFVCFKQGTKPQSI